MRPFSKFVNFRAHAGFKKNPPAAGEEDTQRAAGLLNSDDIGSGDISSTDLSKLSWSDDTQQGAAQSPSTRGKTAESGNRQPRGWFGLLGLTKQQQTTADETPATGKISFQGLTALSETAEKLDALLCYSGRHAAVDLSTAKPVESPIVVPEPEHGCLNDIFAELSDTNWSLHRW